MGSEGRVEERFKVGRTQWITGKLRKIDIERGHTAGRWAIRRVIPSSRGSSRRSGGGDHGKSLGDVVIDSGRKLREFSRVGKRGDLRTEVGIEVFDGFEFVPVFLFDVVM